MTQITDSDREALIERLKKGEFYVLTSTGPKHCGEQAAILIQSTTAMAAEIERLEEWKRDAADELVKMTTRAVNAEAQLDQLRREKAAILGLLDKWRIWACGQKGPSPFRETVALLALGQQEQRT